MSSDENLRQFKKLDRTGTPRIT